MGRYLRVLVVFAALALSIACTNETASNNSAQSNQARTSSTATPAPSATSDVLALGKELYTNHCVECHKDNGKGGPVEIKGKKLNPDDLTKDKFKNMTDEKILGYIVNGVEDEGMPAFKDKMSEAETREVLKYVRAVLQNVPSSNPNTASSNSK